MPQWVITLLQLTFSFRTLLIQNILGLEESHPQQSEILQIEQVSTMFTLATQYVYSKASVKLNIDYSHYSNRPS